MNETPMRGPKQSSGTLRLGFLIASVGINPTPSADGPALLFPGYQNNTSNPTAYVSRLDML